MRVGVGYVAHLGEKPKSYRFLKPEIKGHLRKLCRSGRIILKMDKYVWNAFIWLRARISSGFCEKSSGFLGFIICRGFLV